MPLDPRWSDKECAEKLLLSDADLVIVEDRYIKRIEKYKLDMPVLSLSEWKERISLSINVQSNKGEPEEDPAFYMGFTSGSTGSPKAFIRRQQSWIESFQMTTSVFGITHQDHVLILGTLLSSHFYTARSAHFISGHRDIVRKICARESKNILERGDITAIYTVPTMTESLLQMDAFGKNPLLVLSSGADWGNSSKTARQPLSSHHIFDFYGTSELSFVSYLSSDDFCKSLLLSESFFLLFRLKSGGQIKPFASQMKSGEFM